MWLAAFFPSLLLPPTSAQSKQAVAVYKVEKNVIVQCNHAAKTSGIELGMGLGSASALCADLQIIPYSAEEERMLLMQVLYSLYQLNSDVCLESSNELLIRCDRHDYYYGSAETHLRVLLKQLNKQGYAFHFATANTPEQAIVLASAKINTVLKQDEVLPALYQLPISNLRLHAKNIGQLRRVGIHTVKALFDLPIEELAGRFPQSMIKYLYALKGLHKYGREFYQPAEHFCESIELPFEVDNHEVLLRFVNTLLTLLQSYLQSRNQTTQALTLVFIDNEKCVLPLRLRSGAAKYKAEEWSTILSLTLEKTTLLRPVRSMQLRCENTLQYSPNARDMFSTKRAQLLEAHKLFDVLQTRLGEGAFHPPNSPAFDFASQWPTAVATPPFMLKQPQIFNQQSKVVAGPQRIQTQWWQTPLKRDYFLVETHDTQRLWAYRDDRTNWWIQGYF